MNKDYQLALQLIKECKRTQTDSDHPPVPNYPIKNS